MKAIDLLRDGKVTAKAPNLILALKVIRRYSKTAKIKLVSKISAYNLDLTTLDDRI